MQNYLIGLSTLLMKNTGIIFKHCVTEGDREILTRKLCYSQLGLQCTECYHLEYHYCHERDFFKKELILKILVLDFIHYHHRIENQSFSLRYMSPNDNRFFFSSFY